MDVSARVEYATLGMIGLAASAAAGHQGPVRVEDLALAQNLPRRFLEQILSELRKADLVCSVRGQRGGYVLARPPSLISIGDIFRAVDGPLAEVRGERPQSTSYPDEARHLSALWVALRVSLRRVLDETTVADVLNGSLPAHVQVLIDDPDAWRNR